MNEVTELKMKEILKQIERITEAWGWHYSHFSRIYHLPQYFIKFQAALDSRVDKLLELCPHHSVSSEGEHTCAFSVCFVRTTLGPPTACVFKHVDTKIKLRAFYEHPRRIYKI